MFVKPDTEAFIRLPVASTERVLYPGYLREIAPDSYVGEFQIRRLRVEPGMDLVLHFECNLEFVQQLVCVQSVERDGAQVRLELEPRSDPISAETRLWYRVSAVGRGVSVRIEDDPPTEMLELGMKGFSFVSSGGYVVGQILHAEIEFERDIYVTKVVVKRTQQLPEGALLYGVMCIDSDTAVTGLPRIYAAVCGRRSTGNPHARR